MAPFMLLMIDLFLMVVHGFVVFFNLTGWLWPAARVWHRWCVALTVASWFAVGWLHGKAGDCILTNWLWAVKYARGKRHLQDERDRKRKERLKPVEARNPLEKRERDR